VVFFVVVPVNPDLQSKKYLYFYYIDYKTKLYLSLATYFDEIYTGSLVIISSIIRSIISDLEQISNFACKIYVCG